MWNLKYDTSEPTYKTEKKQTHSYREQTTGYQQWTGVEYRGGGVGGTNYWV